MCIYNEESNPLENTDNTNNMGIFNIKIRNNLVNTF